MSLARVSPFNHDVRQIPERRAKAKAAFSERGETIVSWALERGFNPILVHSVLSGRLKCDRGQAHRIAIELGLKPAPETAA
jgi:gp16 family phage-associated protein